MPVRHVSRMLSADGRDVAPERSPAAPDPADESDPPTTVDVRLLTPAAVVWLVALVVIRVPWRTSAIACLGCLLLLTFLVIAIGALPVIRRQARAGSVTQTLDERLAPGRAVGRVRLQQGGEAPPVLDERLTRGRTAGQSRGGGRTGPVVALCLVVAAAVLGTGACQTAAREAGLLRPLARDGAVGQIEGTVIGEPSVLPPAWPGAPVRVRTVVAADRVAGGGRESRAAGQVAVLGPSSWSALRSGTRVAASGRLRPADPGRRTVAVLLSWGEPRVVSAAPASVAAAGAFRDGIRSLAARLPGDAGALFAGVTIGDTSAIPDGLAAALRSAGLTHVTAVSGAHFSLVAALVLVLTSFVRLPRPARVAVTVVVMAALVLVVHPSPSVLRAAAMGVVALLGVLVGRPHRAPAALGATVVLLLVSDPWLAGELGFVLSVLATGALVILGGPLADRWAGTLGRPLATALALPVAAQLVCAPVILLLTPTVSLYAVPANMLAAPAVAPATVLGLAAGCVAPWWAGGAQVLALGAGAACWWIGAVGRVAAAAPGAQLAWLPGGTGAALLAMTGACALRLLVGRGARSSGCR